MKKIISLTIGFAFIGLTFMLTSGCKKDTTTTTVHDSTTLIDHDTVTNTVWTMAYYEGSAGNNTYYAPPSFIKNGTAKFASNLYHVNGYWFSSFTLPVPKEINLNMDTDSLKLVANMRNVAGDGTAYEMDLGMWFGTGLSYCSATWQRGSDAQYCLLGVGGQQTGYITEQLTDNTVYGEYAISMQGQQATSYKNNTALRTVSYSGTTGRLQQISVSFRGYGEIDWVKLYKGNKLIMIENFNVDGETTALWSKP